MKKALYNFGHKNNWRFVPYIFRIFIYIYIRIYCLYFKLTYYNNILYFHEIYEYIIYKIYTNDNIIQHYIVISFDI